jgi:ribosome maturation factor RimP
VGESPLFCWAKAGAHLASPKPAAAGASGLKLAGDRVRALFTLGVSGEAWSPPRKMDLERIREAAERVARSAGTEVVDVEWKVGRQRFLRVYIDKPEGISHKDCEAVSNQLSVILDVEDLVPGPPYVLEVSSPGLDRKLTKPAEFQRFAGRLARISTTEPIENQKFFEGRLAGFADGKVQIEVKGRMIAVPVEGIRKAHLVVEL